VRLTFGRLRLLAKPPARWVPIRWWPRKLQRCRPPPQAVRRRCLQIVSASSAPIAPGLAATGQGSVSSRGWRRPRWQRPHAMSNCRPTSTTMESWRCCAPQIHQLVESRKGCVHCGWHALADHVVGLIRRL